MTIAYQNLKFLILIQGIILEFNYQLMSHIQNCLRKVNDKGKYQKILVILFLVIYLELGLMLLGSPFIFMNPIIRCGDVYSAENDACQRLKLGQCIIENDYTATYKAELFCDKQNERSFIQSAVYIGAIIGLLVITPFSDSKGKRMIFILGQVLYLSGLLLNFTGIYLKVSWIIVIGQMILGMGGYTVLITGYVIVSEITEVKFKQYTIITLNVVWAISQILIGGFYFWFNHWDLYIIIVLLIPNIIATIFGYFFLVQSPFFLLQIKKDVPATLKAFQTIGKINGASDQTLQQIEKQLYLALKNQQQKQKVSLKQGNVSRFAIFKDSKCLKILLAVAIIEFSANAYYYGVEFSFGQLGTNFGYNILFTGIIETTAYFTSNFFITKVPRKMGIMIFNIICIAMGLLFFVQFGDIVQTVLLGGCRFFNTYSNAIIPMMQNQPFPHVHRSSAWAYIEGISQIGNFITPYIVNGAQNAGVNPLIIFSFMLAVLGIVPLMFYPETMNSTPVDEDGEQSDLKQTMISERSSDELGAKLLNKS